MLSLTELVASYPHALHFEQKWERLVIKALTTDSRKVTPGTLFIAIKGASSDGADYVPEAKRRGAVAVLVEKGTLLTDASSICVIEAENVRKAAALFASRFYVGQPSHMVAVTGTDGKTSTSEFFRQLSALVGCRAASIGTLGVSGTLDPLKYPALNTTPDPVELHIMLSELSSEGYTHVAMEASSHGLDQFRLDGVELKAAAFTNLTRDHLDYHGSLDAYFAAKLRLFSDVLPKGATAVLNADDVRFGELERICKRRGQKVISYGRKAEDFKLLRVVPTLHGQDVEVSLSGRMHLLHLPLVGEFQAMNVLAALGLVQGVGADVERALIMVPELQGVNGRLEKVAQSPVGAPIFIDYAHTPAALANLLRTLRPHVERKLVVVFGCGGDRDKGKRPEMGKAAVEFADHVFITDDNPRTEDAAMIRKSILANAPGAHEIGDRRTAITQAVQSLERGDVLVIAGKGHEKMQIIGKSSYPFDDAAVAREAVELLGESARA